MEGGWGYDLLESAFLHRFCKVNEIFFLAATSEISLPLRKEFLFKGLELRMSDPTFPFMKICAASIQANSQLIVRGKFYDRMGQVGLRQFFMCEDMKQFMTEIYH